MIMAVIVMQAANNSNIRICDRPDRFSFRDTGLSDRTVKVLLACGIEAVSLWRRRRAEAGSEASQWDRLNNAIRSSLGSCMPDLGIRRDRREAVFLFALIMLRRMSPLLALSVNSN